MCQSCIDFDKRIEKQRELLRSIIDQGEIDRINRLISRLYGERLQSHQNPQQDG
jgi:hypothetical protein